MIGIIATDGNDWLAGLRINTRGGADGYRIAGIYTGLLRWGNCGMDLQELIVPAARRAWGSHGWIYEAIPIEQTKDHMWGTAWHPGDWEGTGDEPHRWCAWTFNTPLARGVIDLRQTKGARGHSRPRALVVLVAAVILLLGNVEPGRDVDPDFLRAEQLVGGDIAGVNLEVLDPDDLGADLNDNFF